MNAAHICCLVLVFVARLDLTSSAIEPVGKMKDNLLNLAKNNQLKPGDNPFLNQFLDIHSQPMVELERDQNNMNFNLQMDNRFRFKPPLRKAPFASTGEPWPMPKVYLVDTAKVLHLKLSSFRIKVLNVTCDVLNKAITRYMVIIKHRLLEEPYDFVFNYNEKTFYDRKKQQDEKYKMVLDMADLEIQVLKESTKYPHVDMDESYNLTVKPGVTRLIATEVWGALKGLETFSQLLFKRMNTTEVYAKETTIVDEPRFPHRGILLDTSRHFIHKYVIENVLDGMAYNKFNVLHWHIVDDNSFPYQSEVFPKLSEKGAYHPTLVYSLNDIRAIVEYARLRGIRVVPEFDTPGHTFSWLGYPDIKSTCFQNNEPVRGPLGPINPAQNETYAFMATLFGEIFDVFPDSFTHLGGDELHSDCWATNPSIVSYLQTHAGIAMATARSNPMAYVNSAIGYYFKRLIGTLKETGAKKERPTSFIMWEDVLKNTKEVPKDSILQVWMGSPSNVVSLNVQGYRALYSSCWYLDGYKEGVMWPKYYTCDPSPYFTPAEEKGKILGGEACLWAEFITTETLMTMMWPRACAPAERLWSPRSVTDLTSASRRIQEQRCRMIKRGLPTGHIGGPDYCLRYGNDPLGGHDPLGVDSPTKMEYSEDETVNANISLAVFSYHPRKDTFIKYLPIVNIIVSLLGVYVILIASRCWRKKARSR